jgi:hypothetical protein
MPVGQAKQSVANALKALSTEHLNEARYASRSISSRTLRCVGVSSILLILAHRHQLEAYLSHTLGQQGVEPQP